MLLFLLYTCSVVGALEGQDGHAGDTLVGATLVFICPPIPGETAAELGEPQDGGCVLGKPPRWQMHGCL